MDGGVCKKIPAFAGMSTVWGYGSGNIATVDKWTSESLL